MGVASSSLSADELQEFAKDYVEKKCPISVQFPGFRDNNEAFLQREKTTTMVLEQMPTLVDKLVTYAGGPSGGGAVVSGLLFLIQDSSASIEKALIMLEVKEMIAQNAHSFVKAEMEGIKRQLNLSLAGEERKMHLAIADDSCYKLLVKFDDTNFYLRQKPLAFAPFLTSFVPIYIAVTSANCQLTNSPEYRQDAIRNLQTLHRVIRDYQKETSEHRLSYIKVDLPWFYELTVFEDFFLERRIICHPRPSQGAADSMNYSVENTVKYRAVQSWYKAEIKRKYEYFEPSLRAVNETLEKIREKQRIQSI